MIDYNNSSTFYTEEDFEQASRLDVKEFHFFIVMWVRALVAMVDLV